MMKLVYMASPYAGNIKHNTRMAIEYCRYAASGGVAPIAPHLLFPLFLQDSNSEERKKGIEMGLRFLASCDELWVFGARISEGMGREFADAQRLSIKIRYIKFIENQGVMNMKQWGIWAKRNAASICGAAEAWLKSDGKPMTFDTWEEAAEKANVLMNNIRTVNVSYFPKKMELELDEEPSSGMGMKL